MIRIGEVVAISGTKVRVLYRDDNIVSDWLSTVKGAETSRTYSVGETVLCLYSDNFNSDGFVMGVIE